jgi:arylsulfatase A-like enzyme
MLRTLLLLLLLAAGGFFVWRLSSPGIDAKKCHVLLVVIDTCRADRVGFNGFRLQDGSSPTPNLDAFAEGALGFRWGLSPVPLTLPATTTIMSGLYPDGHGVRENDSFRVAEVDKRSWSLLAEDLRAAGYQTAAFVSGQPLDRKFGLSSGFMVYDEPGRSHRPKHHMQFRERSAPATTDAVLDYLEDVGEEPLFLFVHYFDPHMPYEEAAQLSAAPPKASERAYVSEIARVDQEFGRLMQALPRDGRPCLVIVVGDHGEALGEHGEATHGLLLYESTVRVPFLMRLPGKSDREVDLSVPPRLVDIHPTVLDVTGVEPARAAPRDGCSLLEPAEETWFHRSETLYGWYQLRYARLRSYRDRDLKLIEGGGVRLLFDWRSDVAELQDLAPRQSMQVNGLADSLLTALQNRQGAAAEFLQVEPDAATPYMGIRSRGTPIEPGEEENEKLPLAEQSFEVIRALDLARQLIRDGQFGRAAVLLEGFKAQREQNPSLLFWTARAYQRCDELAGLSPAARLERLDRAWSLFEIHATRFRSTRAMDSQLRVCMRRRHHYWSLSREAPNEDERAGLARRARGELALICRQVEARRTAGTLTVIALASEGQAFELLGRREDALESFEEALQRDPDHPTLLRDVKRLRETLR